MIGNIYWSPDYKTDSGHRQLYRELVAMGAREDSVLSAADALRKLRPGQSLKVTAVDGGSLVWELSDVTDDPS